MTKKVGIYCRISTSGQELENQLDQLRDYATKSKWVIYDEYKDICSGSEDKRPAYDKLFRDAHQKKFDVVFLMS